MKSNNPNVSSHESQAYSLFEKELVNASDKLALSPNPDSWQRLEKMIDSRHRHSPKPIYSLYRWFTYVAAASVLLAVSIWGVNRLSGPPQLIQENIVAEATPYFSSYLATSHELAGYKPVVEGSKINKLSPSAGHANPISGDTILDM